MTKTKKGKVIFSGENLTVAPLRWGSKTGGKTLMWMCKQCGRVWRGKRKMHTEGRKPRRCQRCGAKQQSIFEVAM